MDKAKAILKGAMPWVLAAECAFGSRVYAQAQDSAAPAQHDLSSTGTTGDPATVLNTPALPADTSAGPPPPPDASGNRIFQEVIVTAQKREEKLLSVPISIQAFNADQLDARGINDTAGLQRATPSLDIGTQAGFTSVFLRGVGSEAWLTSDPSVATYVDGIYYPFSPTVVQDFGGVERVEILKGPQGTLFGRNAVGGAINIITKAPDFTQASTEVAATRGSFNTTKSQLFTNIPLNDTVAVNASAFYSYDSTYYATGSTSGGAFPRPDISLGGRFKIRWAPIDNLDMQLQVISSHKQSNSTLSSQASPTPLGTAVGVPQDHGYSVHTDVPLFYNEDSIVEGFTGLYTAPWFDTKIIASNQNHSNPYNYDYDASDVPTASFLVRRHVARIQEGEINFISNHTSPFSEWLNFTAGAFWFKKEQGFDPVELTVGGFNPTQLSDIAALGIQVPQNPLIDLVQKIGNQSLLNSIAGNFPAYALSNIGLIQGRSVSEFVQSTIKFADWASFTAGVRYQIEEGNVQRSSTSLRIANLAQPVVVNWTEARDQANNPFPLSHTTSSLKPKFALDTHPFGDDTLVYASYQQAVKAQAYNAFAFYLPPAYVKPERTNAYEVGFKSTLFEGSTRVSAAGFWYNIRNLQTQFISLFNGGALSIETAGPARSRGFDFDVTSELFPSLLKNVVLTANGAFLNTEYLNYTNGAGYDPKNLEIFSHTNNYTGNRLTRTPKYSASVSLSKSLEVWGGPIEFGTDYYYNSGFFYTASNDPKFSQGAYGTLGARASYLYEAFNLRGTLQVTNLTNKYYSAGELAIDFGAEPSLAPPRFISGRLEWTF